ncbi:unnamed protein product [Strongylus vulgaris]|uniref:Uncharacterized protein n=1 Tax=Strongylus vulgaris TaxID=40348 RepID=A0A3P7JQ62_STRVU|nr:unnamed protein product [Strongylus vulgaris]
MHMPAKIQEAMQMQAAINKAEGEKRAAVLASEAKETEQVISY